MVTINELSGMIAAIAGKKININNIPGPEGVRGRNSDNRLFEDKLGWRVSEKLEVGLAKLYPWIVEQTGG